MAARATRIALAACFVLAGVAQLGAGEQLSPSIEITSPLDGAVFPRDFAPPIFRWRDGSYATRWRVTLQLPGGSEALETECEKPEWRPGQAEWELVKSRTIGKRARLLVSRLPQGARQAEVEASGTVAFVTSPDPVNAPIFFREVPLPVGFAMDNKPLIKWKVGDVSSEAPPRTVLSGMTTCANCHSFSADGKTLAMDIDFGADKGAYAIAGIGSEVRIEPAQIMSWNDYRKEDGQPTLGLLSAIAPDGRRVVSTVKETIVLKFVPDLFCSQLFFPIRGILVAYDLATKTFNRLEGAADPGFVQTNPAFSPDGRWLVFARARVPDLPQAGLAVEGGLSPSTVEEYGDGRRVIRYDLYRMPFSEGRGGRAEPLPGASMNGKSNYFARFSPDGRWIVFCQAGSMMLNRPDSELYIMPASGGTPRRLSSNAAGRMNSWHSFSPNGHWLVYASKAGGPYTQMWLTHIDTDGLDTTPVVLDGFVVAERAANIPEFVNLAPGALQKIDIADVIRNSTPKLPARPR